MDQLRLLFAAQPAAKIKHYSASDFSYNNKTGACPQCKGLGVISLDIQFLPDMEETCPLCKGQRYKPEIQQVKWHNYSIVDILEMSVNDALPIFADNPVITHELKLLKEVGLGYLHLGESTPTLSGGEAQRLKLVMHLNRKQANTLFVFDEPTIGLHPIDVQTLLQIIKRLQLQGATVIMITHDLDVMINADYLLDLGPKGGKNGGKIVASGKPRELIKNPKSLTTMYLANYFHKFQK